jgi:glycogen debranching enzyme
MDAKVGNHVVTPRMGCPVEINALWYNALSIYSGFQKALGEKVRPEITELIDKSKEAFETFFVNENGYLNDVVLPERRIDDKIRPNQLYAVSLPFSPISKAMQGKVLDKVQEHLLTPYGLRTLAPSDPDFKADYAGDAWSRDNAYHQGTVWPFLIGEWALAYLKLHKFSKASCKHVWAYTEPLRKHFYKDGCRMAIAEIFDGLHPSVGKGCVQQAWSVGALLQVFLHPSFSWKFLPSK